MAQSLPGGYKRWLATAMDEPRDCDVCHARLLRGFSRELWRPGPGPAFEPVLARDTLCAACFWGAWQGHLWGLNLAGVEALLEEGNRRLAPGGGGQKDPKSDPASGGGDPKFLSGHFSESEPELVKQAREAAERGEPILSFDPGTGSSAVFDGSTWLVWDPELRMVDRIVGIGFGDTDVEAKKKALESLEEHGE